MFTSLDKFIEDKAEIVKWCNTFRTFKRVFSTLQRQCSCENSWRRSK